MKRLNPVPKRILNLLDRRPEPRVLMAAILAFMPFLDALGVYYAQAQIVPQRITFQGRLTDSNNNPLTGSHDFVFEIYDSPANGVQLWTETQNGITVTNGVLSAQLGAVTPLTDDVFEGGGAYLQITVDGETLSPRQRLISSPYAFVSESISGRTYQAFVSTDATAQTVAGDKTFSGTVNPSANLNVGGAGYSVTFASSVSADYYYGDGSGLTGVQSSQDAAQDTEIAALSVSTDVLRTDVDANSAQFAQVATDTTTLRTDINANGGQFTQVAADTTTLRTDIDANSAQFAQVATDTTTLRTDIDGNSAQFTQVGIDTATLRTDVDANAAQFLQVGIDTATLRTDMDANSVQFTQVATDTTTLRTDIDANTAQLTQVAVDTTTLKTDVDDKLPLGGGTLTGDLTMSTDADVNLSGPTGYITTASSVTASAFFGDGSALSNVSSAQDAGQDGEIAALSASTETLRTDVDATSAQLTQVAVDTTTLKTDVDDKLPLGGGTLTGDLTMSTDADVNLSGPTGYITTASSVTASAFFGDGSALSNVSSAQDAGQDGEIAALSASTETLRTDVDTNSAQLTQVATDTTTLRTDVDGKVSLAGDYMTGQLTIAGSTLSVTGDAFSVGGSTLTVMNGRVGIGQANPAERLHVQDGHILVNGTGELNLGFQRTDLANNPLFTQGRIEIMGDGSAALRYFYYDDSLGGERMVFAVDDKGIIASIHPTGQYAYGSHFEGFVSGDVMPLFRLNSYPKMQLEMGPGGNTVDTDVYIRRQDVKTLALMTGGTEWLRIDPAGFVGISTGAPQARVHISSGTGEAGNVLIVSTGTSSIFRVTGEGQVHASHYFGDGSNLTNVSGSDPDAVQKTGDFMTGQLTIANSTLTVTGDAFSVGGSTLSVANGWVGVGTTDPVSRLHLTGGGWTEIVTLESTRVGSYPFYELKTPSVRWFMLGDDSSKNFRIKSQTGASSVTRLTIQEDGNVGIGTTAPGAPLHVSSAPVSATDPVVIFSTGAAASQELLRVRRDGKVGIGLSAPAYPLEIIDEGITARLMRYDTANNDMQTALRVARQVRLADGAAGFGTRLTFELENAASDDFDAGGVGALWTDATGGAEDGALVLYVRGPDGAALNEKMRIDSAGRAGIGLTNPSERLEVKGGHIKSEYGVIASTLVLAGLAGSDPTPAQGMLFFDSDGDGALKLSLDGSSFVPISTGTVGSGLSQVTSNAQQFSGDGTSGDELTLVSSSVTLQGNAFNGASQLLRLDGSGDVPLANLSGVSNAQLASDAASLAKVTDSTMTLSQLGLGIMGQKVGIGLTGPSEKLHVAGGGIRLDKVSSASGEQDSNALVLGYQDSGDADQTAALRINPTGSSTSLVITDSRRAEVARIWEGAIKFDDSDRKRIQAVGTGEYRLYYDATYLALNSGSSTDDAIYSNAGQDLWLGAGKKASHIVIDEAAGNVGLGTNAPGAPLHVSSAAASGTDPIVIFSTGAAAAEELFRMRADGNVGIGVTDPAEALDVNGGVKVGDTSGTNQGTIRYNSGSFQGYTASGWKNLDEGASDSGWTDDGAVVRLTAPGDNVVVASTLTVNGDAFSVGASTLAVRDGMVGVGVSNPARALDVGGDVQVSGVIIPSNGNTASEGLYWDGSAPGDTASIRYTDSSSLEIRVTNDSTDELVLWSSGLIKLSKSGVNSLVVSDASNVGILDADPDARLEVVGDMMVSSAWEEDGNRFIINSAGNVGISTRTPTRALDVNGGIVARSSMVVTGETLSAETDLGFQVMGSTFVVKRGGNVGIGTSNPSSLAALEVNGAIYGRRHQTVPAYSFESGAGSGLGMLASGGVMYLLAEGPSGSIALNTQGYSYSAANTKVLVTNSGEVGVGTTVPTARLHVSSANATANEVVLKVSSGTAPGQELLVVEGGGGIGVGIVDPAERLEVDGGVKVGDTSGTNQGTIRYNSGTFQGYTASGWKDLDVQSSGNGWTDVGSSVRLETGGDSVGIGAADPKAALHVSSSPLAGTSAVLLVSSGAAAAQQLVRVQRDGSVGLGVASPSTRLELPQNTAIKLGNAYMSSGIDTHAHFASNGWYSGASWQIPDAGKKSAMIQMADDVMRFYQTQTAGGTDWVERMRINPGGNVGIGATNPSKVLHVSAGSSGVGANVNSDMLLEDDGHAYLNINSPDGSEAGVLFGEPTLGDAAAGIVYNNPSTPDGLQLRVNGNTTEMVIQAGGNVGIGLTDPAASLEVEPDEGDDFTLQVSSQNGTAVMVVDKDGDVGIGTSDPAQALSVVSASQTEFAARVYNNNATNGRGLTIAAGVAAGDQILQASDRAGTVRMVVKAGGEVGVGLTNASATLHVSSAASTGTTEILRVSSGTQSGAELLVVRADGKVGIGTTNPGENLALRAESHAAIAVDTNHSSRNTGVNFINSGDGTNTWGVGRYYSGDAFIIAAKELDTSVSWADARLAILPDGKTAVGLDTIPQATLHVSSKNAVAGTSVLLVSTGTAAGQGLFLVNSDGQVGIGVSNPAATLEIEPYESDDFTLQVSSQNGNAVLIVDKGGNAGVGLANPAEKLDVAGGVKVGDTAGTNQGTIRYNSGTFQGYTASGWKDLDVQSGAGGWTDDGAVVRLTTVSDNVVIASTMTVEGDGFSVGGSTLVVTQGRVGIGATNPAFALQLEASGNAVKVADGATVGLQIDTGNNRTGIGTSSLNTALNVGGDRIIMFQGGAGSLTPVSGLHNPGGLLTMNIDNLRIPSDVSGARVNILGPDSGTNPTLALREGSGGGPLIRFEDNGGTEQLGIDAAGNLYRTDAGGTSVTNLGVYHDATAGWGAGEGAGILLQTDNTSNTRQPLGSLEMVASEVAGDLTADFVLKLHNDSATSDERLRVKADGKTGIGETDPAARLEIKPSEADGFTLQVSSQNGTAVVVVDKDGEVGIGTTAPGTALHVKGDVQLDSTGGANYLRFLDNGTDEWNIQRLDSDNSFRIVESGVDYRLTILPTSGNVGIGTTNPSYASLELKTTDKALFIHRDADANHGLYLTSQGTPSSTEKRASVATRGAVDQHLFLNAGRDDSLAHGNIVMAADVLGNVGVGVLVPTALMHISSAGATSATEVLQVSSGTADSQALLMVMGDGKVGIGNSGPDELLHIGPDTLSPSEGVKLKMPDFEILSLQGGSVGMTTTGTDGTNGNLTVVTETAFWVRDANDGTWDFYVGGDRVGVGVNTPQSLLDVEGNMAVGASYSGTTAAPTNGLLVEGNAGFGTTSAPVDSLGHSVYVKGNGSSGNLGGMRLISNDNSAGYTELGFGIGTGTSDLNWSIAAYDRAYSGGLAPANSLALFQYRDKNVANIEKNRFLLSESGRVGIGDGNASWNTEPKALLHVSSASATSADRLLLVSQGQAGTEHFLVRGDGRVGIGATNPTTALDARGGATFNDDGGAVDFRVESDNVTTMLLVDGDIDAMGIGMTASAVNTLNVGELYPTVSADETNYRKVLDVQAYDLPIDNGFTDSGYRIAIAAQNFTNDANFQGTLASQYGIWSRVGSNTGSPTGTITNSYAIFLENLEGGATVTNKYGLYQENTSAKNYFGGRLGVGVTDPAAQLEVEADEEDDFTIQVSSQNGTAVMVVDKNGRLGVGTTTPNVTLHAHKTSGSNYIYVTNDGTAGSDHNSVWFARDKDGTPDWAGIGQSGNGQLRLTGGGNLSTPDMTITDGGDVGIGTTNPAATLEVDAGTDSNSAIVPIKDDSNIAIGSGYAQVKVINDNSTAGNYAKIGFADGAGEGAAGLIGVKINDHTNNRGDLQLWTRGSGSVGIRVHVDQEGQVGIGTTNPSDKLHVAGDARVGTGTTGCVKDADATVIAGSCSSDLRLKKDVEPFENVLARLVRLQPVHFHWRAEEYPEMSLGRRRSFGLIAQDVEKVMPELVTEDERRFKAVRYNKLALLLLQAVKEQHGLIERLESRISELEKRKD